MATSKTPRTALSFEEFVDVALSAAVKAAARQKIPGTKPGQLPFPIWIGIVAGPFNQGGPLGGGTLNQ